MTITNEQIQALKAAAESVIQAYGDDWFGTGSQICTLLKSKVNLIAAANPAPSIPAVPDECPKCDGTGMMDSGGVQPWGDPIQVVCDCRYEVPDTAVPENPPFAVMQRALDAFYAESDEVPENQMLAAYRVFRAAMLNGGKS